MAQKLILPINKCKLTASYKNAAYKTKYGYTHYGIDMVSTAGSTKIYASGNGTIVNMGWDDNAGNVIVIRYDDAYDKASGTYKDVVFRYYHLDSIHANRYIGETINKDKVLGYYGGSGMGQQNYWSAHLHIEADTDTAYPCYSPTFSGSTQIIKGASAGANDSTMSSALNWLYVKNTSPDYQTYTTAGDAYINSGDTSLATY
ncbi:MAG: M23 family metallopeptidase [Oscillospiraceae bacterium]|nr:M23 family metallopeptidase [Oscillospiraceae bacterium]